ncbi:MAG: AhpC/TSA family protein [Planctomycetota bacterium]|nr:AhpC/TSA family protein [Planctomycetota bacterium]
MAEDGVAAKPEEAKGLQVGEAVPDVQVKTAKGEAVSLLTTVKAKPAVLIFYRGGWCPYCNRHLSALQKIEGDFAKLGYQILAVSPESVASIGKTGEKDALTYTLLSDESLAASKAFKLAFQVDDATKEKYKGYKIDLDGHRWILPVPAVYVTDKDGKIAYAHVNPDYKQRLDPEKIAEAARKAVEGKP